MRLTEGRLGRICMSKPLGSTFPGGFFLTWRASAMTVAAQSLDLI